MKVEFIQTLGGKDYVYAAGEVHDLPKVQAERLIDHEICKEVKEVKKVEAKLGFVQIPSGEILIKDKEIKKVLAKKPATKKKK